MNLTTETTSAFLRLLEIEQLRAFICLELRQMEEEGFGCAGFQERLDKCGSTSELANLYTEFLVALGVKEFPYNEPETLTGIRRARPDGPRHVFPDLDPATLFDRIHGNWLGRVTGCVLGKPVEPFVEQKKIIRYLKMAGCYPLSGYIPLIEPVPQGFPIDPNAKHIFRDDLNGAPDDDDTDYTILNLHMLEKHGLHFSTEDVAGEWLTHLAYHKTWTAERAVYRNLILGISQGETAHVLNPEREYIGARIRADIYGLACPGNPELAAELAFRDASLSHTKNGIYCTMFMAACIAWAYVTDDIEEIIQVGLSEIPANCRQAEAVRDVLATHHNVADWQAAYEKLLGKYGHYHPVHAINNTAFMVLAMLYGGNDFEKTICIATLCGFDTDCNSANAGTVLGILTGAEALPTKWINPLHDTLRTAVAQFGEMRISELAHRTARIAQTFLSILSNKE